MKDVSQINRFSDYGLKSTKDINKLSMRRHKIIKKLTTENLQISTYPTEVQQCENESENQIPNTSIKRNKL